MQVRFHPDALTELVGSLAWYSARSERAAERFALEFEQAVLTIRDAPMRGPAHQHGTRRIRMRRFPFALVYRVGAGELQVLAVAHLHRRPGYWMDRTSG